MFITLWLCPVLLSFKSDHSAQRDSTRQNSFVKLSRVGRCADRGLKPNSLSANTTRLNSTQLAVGLSWVGSYRHVKCLRLVHDNVRQKTTASWSIWRFLTCLESVASRNPVGIIPANQREVRRVTSRPVYRKCARQVDIVSIYCGKVMLERGTNKMRIIHDQPSA